MIKVMIWQRIYNEAEALQKNKGESYVMKYVCEVCGWIYDEAMGDEDLGIAAGTKFEDLPEDFLCPLCMVGKEQFDEME